MCRARYLLAHILWRTMYFDDFVMMMVWIAMALFFIGLIRRLMQPKQSASTAAASTAKPQTTAAQQMAEDIKTTKTSQVEDAVAILNDLSSTSSNYRHYCELVGNSMASSSIVAPYSKRPVAYYDIKCYRIERTYNGRQEETLVAHERSFDPFFFTDASCDTPIYVDLDSFGENVILVNSTNHIEGPNSDFAKAFERNATTATSATGTAFAMVAHEVERAGNALLNVGHTLRNTLAPRGSLAPAYALAGGGTFTHPDSHLGSNVMFAGPNKPTPRDDHSSDKGTTHGRGGGRGAGDRGNVNVHMGNGGFTVHMGGNTMPPHLGDFMGSGFGGPWVMGGGYTTHRPTTTSADVLLGMSLGALLNSMNTVQPTVVTTSGSSNTFVGYRLVENVVPLSSPIYCIGEIYHNGNDIYMGRSLAKDYPTSYFATKPESEVLTAIGSR